MNVDNKVIEKLIELVSQDEKWENSTDEQQKVKCIILMLQQILEARKRNKIAYENGENRDYIKYDIASSLKTLEGLIEAW